MSSVSENERTVWVTTPKMWLFMLLAAALLGVIFYAGIREMVIVWNTSEEFSYGYMIPFITLFLIWQKLEQLGYDLLALPFVLRISRGLVLLLLGLLQVDQSYLLQR